MKITDQYLVMILTFYIQLDGINIALPIVHADATGPEPHVLILHFPDGDCAVAPVQAHVAREVVPPQDWPANSFKSSDEKDNKMFIANYLDLPRKKAQKCADQGSSFGSCMLVQRRIKDKLT